jgi:small subunit ribosomal protein S14
MVEKTEKKTRGTGKAMYRCRRCNRTGAVIRKYDLMYCRQCFREVARSIGFKKYS